MIAAAVHLAPDAAVLLLTLGLLLICVELNRPGWIVPGALGLLLALFAVARCCGYELSRAAVALLATALALLLLDLLRPTPMLVAVAATLALVLGLRPPGGWACAAARRYRLLCAACWWGGNLMAHPHRPPRPRQQSVRLVTERHLAPGAVTT
jgi:hypothetical protein